VSASRFSTQKSSSTTEDAPECTDDHVDWPVVCEPVDAADEEGEEAAAAAAAEEGWAEEEEEEEEEEGWAEELVAVVVVWEEDVWIEAEVCEDDEVADASAEGEDEDEDEEVWEWVAEAVLLGALELAELCVVVCAPLRPKPPNTAS
jgi:hypothetical protein